MQLEKTGYFQRQRLEFIEYRIEYFGGLSRNDLFELFECASASATRDIALYKSLAPNNLELTHQNKTYKRTSSFKPLFKHCAEKVLYSLISGFSGSISESPPIETSFLDKRHLTLPSCKTLGVLARAINTKSIIKICCANLQIDARPLGLEISLGNEIMISYIDKSTESSEEIELKNCIIIPD